MPDWKPEISKRLETLNIDASREQEIVEELALHLDDRFHELLAAGTPESQAFEGALKELDESDWLEDELRRIERRCYPDPIVHGSRQARIFGNLLQDVRFGFRMLLKYKGFTVLALITLALGIGANATIFSVLNAVLLSPLPYEDAGRLVFLSETDGNARENAISYQDFKDWRDQNHVFEGIGVYNRDSYNLTGSGTAERLLTAQASADFFPVLGVNPILGRVFNGDEDKAGAAPVVVLSYGLWQRRFGGDPAILNKALTLNGKSYTVIGIAPNGFQYPSRIEMWVPAGQLSAAWQERGNHPGLYAVARLRPGVTLAQAQAEMDLIAGNLANQYPDSNTGSGVNVQPLLEIFVKTVRTSLWVLFGSVGFVLLIACANIASLQLARAAARRKEIAIRMAIGAGRGRIVRQLLTESVMLACAGGALGLMVARWGVALILYVSPTAIPRADEIRLDWRVLVFTCGVALLTGIFSGLVPAFQSWGIDVQHVIRDFGQGTPARQRFRALLLVAEIAATLVLLIGAGLMITSFYRLNKVDPGFDPDHVTSFGITLPQKKYASIDQRVIFFKQLLENLRGLPGVNSAAAASGLPLSTSGWQVAFTLRDRPAPPINQTPQMDASLVTPDYFRVMGIPLKRGRVFDEHDDRSFLNGRDLSKLSEDEQFVAGMNSIIIDEDFARRYWPAGDALGKQVSLGTDPRASALTVVGVVGRVKIGDLGQPSDHVQAYLPYAQMAFNGMTIVVKSSVDAGQLSPSVREQVKAVDVDQPIYNVANMDERRSNAVAPERLSLTLISIFAGIALALAVVGIYGVISLYVSSRTTEFGIRMALGAQPNNVLRLVVGHGLKLTIAGVVIGLGGAYALTHLIQSLLFGVKATNPWIFAIVTAVLSLVALIACYFPARRATRVDPLAVLRSQ